MKMGIDHQETNSDVKWSSLLMLRNKEYLSQKNSTKIGETGRHERGA